MRAGLFSFEYNPLPKLISNFYHYMDQALMSKTFCHLDRANSIKILPFYFIKEEMASVLLIRKLQVLLNF